MSSTQQQQQQLKRGKGHKGGAESSKEKVVVAVKASKEISRTALVWALTHVVQPGDCITLLVVVPPHSSGDVSPTSRILLPAFVRASAACL